MNQLSLAGASNTNVSIESNTTMRIPRTQQDNTATITNAHLLPSTSSDAARARTILEKRLEQSIASATSLFERLATDIPKDDIVRSQALTFGYDPVSHFPTTARRSTSMVLTMGLGTAPNMTVHNHAQRQIAERVGVPQAYLAELLDGERASTWSRDLAVDILNRHYNHGEQRRHLVRSVRDDVRGFLSDKFRRLDSRPLADAVASECHKMGAVAYDGVFSDTRVALKVILPTIYEPVAGEALAIGGEWSNSDYGAGTNSFRWFIMRCWCLNGTVGASVLKKIHLNNQLPNNITFSTHTYKLNTATNVSALRDAVRSTLGPAKVQAILAGIKSAHEEHLDWKHVPANIIKQLTKTEARFAQDAFDGLDVVNLPAGKTAWRASNALSWLAGHTDDADRRLELERLAGAFVRAA